MLTLALAIALTFFQRASLAALRSAWYCLVGLRGLAIASAVTASRRVLGVFGTFSCFPGIPDDNKAIVVYSSDHRLWAYRCQAVAIVAAGPCDIKAYLRKIKL